MSTKLTTSPRGGFELAQSHALALTQAARAFQDAMTAYLLAGLAQRGFPDVTGPQLAFLGALDCGANHGSEIARRLGVSRQAAHKTVRDLADAGWLETGRGDGPGNQRAIRFTVEGERMMAEARALFAALDAGLIARHGEDRLKELTALLEAEISAPDAANGP